MCWAAAKGRALDPPWWVKALSLVVGEYSDETDFPVSAQGFYTHGRALSEDWEAQTAVWMLKVHPTLLCGGTKGKGLTGYLYIEAHAYKTVRCLLLTTLMIHFMDV